MIKILHYGLSMNPGGIENYLVKLWDHVDQKQYQFMFVDLYEGKACFRKELEDKGCQFYNITHRRKSFVQNYKDWKNLFAEATVDIVHCHLNTLSDLMPVFMGLRYGKKVIVHSRSSQMAKSVQTVLLHRLNSILLPQKKITMVAVSKNAGEWLFGKHSDFQVIHNGVDLDRFYYDEEKRSSLRTKFGLQGKFVIGHVGVFLPVKNHAFLLKVFQAVREEDTNARLVLIGDGPLRAETEVLAKKLGIWESAFFLGKRSDVADWYSAMDVLVFPSFFEGFPNVVLEAQATGLPCVISDVITDEVIVQNNVFMYPLEGHENGWKEKILEQKKHSSKRIDKNTIHIQKYSFNESAQKISSLYL